MSQQDTFGLRLRSARTDAGFTSVASIVTQINQHLEILDKEPISQSAWREWEKLGTPLENRKLKTHMPYYVYPIFCGLTGVTGYWLFYGDAGGVIKHIADLPTQNQKWIGEQLQAIKCPRRQSLLREFMRLIAKISDAQQHALHRLLKLF